MRIASSSGDNSKSRSNAVKGASDPRAGSDGAQRTLRLLAAFSRERHTLTAKELAVEADIPVPSVYRYLAALRDTGFLIDDRRGAYHLSAKLVALADAADAADPLIEIADPAMRELGRTTNETVLLVRMIDLAAVCVHRVEARRHLRISFEPGQALPLDRGASARVLLASLPPERRRAVIAAVTGSDSDRAHDLSAAVARTAERGWATSEEEIDPDVWAAAAPIMDGRRTVAALSVPSPLSRTTAESQTDIVAKVRATANDISQRLAELRQ